MQTRRHPQDRSSKARIATRHEESASYTAHTHHPTCNLMHICHKRNIRNFENTAQPVVTVNAMTTQYKTKCSFLLEGHRGYLGLRTNTVSKVILHTHFEAHEESIYYFLEAMP